MVKNILFIAFVSFVLVSSCSKDSTSNNTTNPIDTASQQKILEIKTSFGNMYLWLNKETPLHRANYLALADSNYLDGSTFHRIVTNFVIQGGDPNSKDADTTNDGTGGPVYKIPAEINTSLFKHAYGAVGAARDGNAAKASSGSQFYIVVNKAGQANLDGNYTVFGKVIKGMDVAELIVKQPKNATNNRPYTNITMDVNVLTKTNQELKDEFNFTP